MPRKSLHSSINNLSYKSLLIILFFLLINIVVLWKFVLPNHKVEASWWNDGWNYRKAISISNTSGSNLTDFQISLSIGTSALIASGKMQSDCDDIRITDINGNLLPFWIHPDFPCNTDTTKIFVKVPSIPTSDATIFLYYGNTSASSNQDPLEVFDLWDDFTDANLNSNKWNTTGTSATGSITVINGYVSLNNTSNADTVLISKDSFNENNYIIESRLKVSAYSTDLDGQFGWSAGARSGIGTYDDTVNGYEKPHRIYTPTIVQGTEVMTTTWKPFTFQAKSGDIKSTFGTETLTSSTTHSYSSGPVYFYTNTVLSTHIDFIALRKYASVEPTLDFQSEEVGGGPIAYWKFDEGTGTTAYDSSSNSHTSTLQNETSWATEDQCISGKCLKFDGVNDYVSAGIGTDYLPLDTFSMCAWVKSPGLASGMSLNGIMSYTYGLTMALDSAGQFWTRIDNGSNLITVTTPGNLYDNKFHHVCVTFDGTNRNLYVDGKLKKATATTWNNRYSSNSVNIGHENNSSSIYKFNGFIDEPKIYRYARTADQIKKDYNSRGGSSQGTSANLGTAGSDNNLSEGLVGYWKMDEGVGTSITDSSGNSNTGTFGTGSSAPSWSSGKFGIGTSFDGTNDYISLGTIKSIGEETFSFWFKSTSTSTGHVILATNSTASNYGISRIGDNLLFLRSGSNYQYFNNIAQYYDGQWHHLVITVPGGSQTDITNTKAYIDNKEMTKGSGTASTAPGSYNNFYIATGSYGYFNGAIDEVRIYNRSLSPSEVSQLYEFAPGPVGYWGFDDGSGSTAKDKSGNNLNGTIIGNAVWKSGGYCKIGGCLTLDHVDDRITVNHSSLLEPASITIEGWVKLNSTGDRQILFTKWYGYSFEINSSGYPYFRLYGSSPQDLYSSKAITWGEWHHIAATLDNDTKIKTVYLDGINVGSTVTTGSISYNQSTLAFPYSSASYGSGFIDEFKIYNYARSAKQIVEDMNAGAPAASTKSVLAYYKFDEGSGTTVYNYGIGGTALNGTFGTGSSAPSWTNEGKNGKALSLDGNDYVDTQNFPSLGNTFTVSLWTKANNFSSTYNPLICRDGNTNNNMCLRFDVTGNIEFRQYGGSEIRTSNSFSANNWIHIVAVSDNLNGKIYVNGNLEAGGTFPVSFDDTGNISFSKYSYSSGYFYNGLIDEVKIYNYALTAEEIKQDYNQNSALQMGQTSQTIGGTTTSLEYCIPGDTSYCAAPVGEWKMDEGSGTSAKDTSGNNNTGTLYNSPSWTQGKIGSALNFNGSNNYIGVPYSSNLAPSAITFEAWAYKPSWTDAEASRILSKTETGGYTLLYSSGSIYSYIYRNGAYSTPSASTSELSPGWHYFTGSYDGRYNRIYIDGVLKNTDDAGANYPITYSYSNSLIIGAEAGSGTSPAGTYFTGKIDHIKIYDYARTPAQIAYDYNKGGPVGWWKFDECQGNIAYDWSGIGNTGTIIVGASGTQNSLGTCSIGTSAAWTNGSIGHTNGSLNFDGTDDYVSVNDNDVLDPSQITISAWVKPSSLSNSGNFIGKGDNSGYRMRIYSTGSIGFLDRGSTNGLVTATGVCFVGNWYHIVGVGDNNGLKIYLNGKLLVQNSTAYGGPNTSSPLKIGLAMTSEYFQGQIDDVRIYNYALTPEQVKILYNNGAVNFN